MAYPDKVEQYYTWLENNKFVRNKIEQHNIKAKEWLRKRREQWRRKGFCTGCGHKKIKGGMTCLKCLSRSSHPKRDSECAICNSKDVLEFHHTNYERNEGITLCRCCHLLQHHPHLGD